MRNLNIIIKQFTRHFHKYTAYYPLTTKYNKSFNYFQNLHYFSTCNSKHYQIHKTSTILNEKLIKQTIRDLPFHKHTICALASGSGACGVAVLRISGSHASELCAMMLNGKMPKPRYATYCKIYHPVNKGLVDTGLALWFPGPNSFTGEDVLELQVHGSPAIVKCLLAGIVETELARIAQAGEFTRRAFYNNKMDLAEVEGLRDLLNAETDIQRKQALAMSRGVQSRKINKWISCLTDCTSSIDGHIEFADTDDVTLNMAEINSTLSNIQGELQQAIRTSAKGFTIKNGINIALYGATNVGKSSLLNALTSEDRAIVSDMPNTTRDLIQVRMDLNGYAANLTDTAGFYNDPAHRVETDAMQKSIDVLFDVNTAIHVLVISANIYLQYAKMIKNNDIKNVSSLVLKQYIEDMFVSGLIRMNSDNVEELFVKSTIIVVTKTDLIEKQDLIYFNDLFSLSNVVGTSMINNTGIDSLFDCFNQQLKEMYTDFSPEDVQFNSIRTLEAVKKASKFIDDAISVGETQIDTKAQFMRAAIGHLAGILGKSCTSDMLDDIFENFCIGK